MSCLQSFTTKEILNNHKERCLLINETQAVEYETGIIKFKNFDKEIPTPFKIHVDTKCLLKRVNTKKGEYTKLCQKHIDNKFTLPTKLFADNNCINNFIKWIFEQQERINQIIDDHFNKKLKLTIEDENNYQNSQDCWIGNEKLDDKKVRDYCHITGKYRGVLHIENVIQNKNYLKNYPLFFII